VTKLYRAFTESTDEAATTQWKVSGKPDGLSITRSKSLLVAIPNARVVQEYTTRGMLIKEIKLEDSMDNPKHAIQLSSGYYVVCHVGVEQHRVCIVDTDGNIKMSYGGKRGVGIEELNYPCRLMIDSHEYVFVADEDNHRIQALSPTLGYLGEMMFHGHQLARPMTMHLDELNRRLYVGDTNGKLIVASLVLTSSLDVWSKRRKT